MADSGQREPPLLSRLRPPPGAVTPRRRVGRGPGSGLGTTAGKGQKGQWARGVGKVHPWREGGQTPLIRRLPKVGFKNPFTRRVATVNVLSLERFAAGTTVDPEALIAAKLVRGRFDLIKVLGKGKLDRALTVRAHAFSEGAKALIEQAGGKAELLESPWTRAPEAEVTPS